MNIKITTSEEFIEAIDAYGDLIADIDNKRAEAKLAKERIELYANENEIIRETGKHYRLMMKKGSAALRCQAGVTEANVLAMLKKSAIGKDYIVPTYDTAALKHDFGHNADGIEQLAEFGLELTSPKRHAEVSAI